jgi:hypothetical protein
MAIEEYPPEEWDLEHFRRAGEVLATISLNRDAIRDARQAILSLYFRDNGGQDGQVAEYTT